MKKEVTVSMAFLSLSTGEKPAEGNTMISGITKSAGDLPNLPVTVVGLTALNKDLSDKYALAKDGGHIAITERNTAEKVWNVAFKSTALYVKSLANGDATFIAAAGMKSTVGETTPKAETVGLLNFKATVLATPGSAEIENESQTQADGYVYFLTPETATIKQVGDAIIITIGGLDIYVVPDTHHDVVQTGLTSNKKLSVYGVAFNNKGTGPLSKVGHDITPQ